jgi:uncharacterized repeat protein (TIGR02543 family)
LLYKKTIIELSLVSNNVLELADIVFLARKTNIRGVSVRWTRNLLSANSKKGGKMSHSQHVQWTKRPLAVLIGFLLIFSILPAQVYADPTAPPTARTGVQISAGANHSLALLPDGTVWAWGQNEYGQLGNGTRKSSLNLVQVKNLTDVVSVSAGEDFSVALKSDGTVYTWGLNHHNQLGNVTTIDNVSPKLVPGLTGVVSISAGRFHVLALKSDGTVWAWGQDYFGQLGDGTATTTTVGRPNPEQVLNLYNVVAISGGGYFSVALDSNGDVWAWGDSVTNGMSAVSANPTKISTLTNVVSISAGYMHSLAVKSDGTVWAWGSNGMGALGDDSTVSRSAEPVQVKDLDNVVAVSTGTHTAYAVKSDGTVWAWGINFYGELGDGTIIDRHTPVQTDITDVSSISAGYDYAIAVKDNGTLWIWGSNGNYLFGDTTSNKSATPLLLWGAIVTFDQNYPEAPAPHEIGALKGNPLGPFMPVNPTRTDYVFKGWNTDPNGKGTAITSATVVKASITVYAQWDYIPSLITLTPTDIIFTPATPGYCTQATQKVTIKNNGKTATGALTIVLSGANANAFTLSKTSQTSLAANGSGTFTVKPVNGLAPGTYTATVTVSNASVPARTVNLSFTVNALQYSIDVSPTDVYFLTELEGYKAPAAQTVKITNTGNTATGNLTIKLEGDGASEYTISKTSQTSLAVGATGTFTVKPKTGLAPGAHAGTVVISNANVTEKLVSLSFTVDPKVFGIVLVPEIDVFPEALQGYGTQSSIKVIIANTSNTDTGSLSIKLGGANASAFTLSKTTQASIAYFSEGEGSFTVKPKTGLAPGTYIASITVSNANVPAQTVNLSFTVVPRVYSIALSPTDLTFPSATQYYPMQFGQGIDIANTGNMATGTMTIALSGSNPTAFTIVQTSHKSINVHDSGGFVVRPANGLAPGTYTATLTVSNANVPTTTVNLSFTVVPV